MNDMEETTHMKLRFTSDISWTCGYRVHIPGFSWINASRCTPKERFDELERLPDRADAQASRPAPIILVDKQRPFCRPPPRKLQRISSFAACTAERRS
eukprot:IDg11487t1